MMHNDCRVTACSLQHMSRHGYLTRWEHTSRNDSLRHVLQLSHTINKTIDEYVYVLASKPLGPISRAIWERRRQYSFTRSSLPCQMNGESELRYSAVIPCVCDALSSATGQIDQAATPFYPAAITALVPLRVQIQAIWGLQQKSSSCVS